MNPDTKQEGITRRKRKWKHVNWFFSSFILCVTLLLSHIFQNAISHINKHSKVAKESLFLDEMWKQGGIRGECLAMLLPQ